MSEFISEEERERIAEFARTPGFKRDPDQLVPDDEEE
jgi:hypothetical protein